MGEDHSSAGPGLGSIAEHVNNTGEHWNQEIGNNLEELMQVLRNLSTSVDRYESIPGLPETRNAIRGRAILELIQTSGL